MTYDEWPDPAGISLRGLYGISVLAMCIGISVVFVLNFATPMHFVIKQFADLAQKTGLAYVLEVGKRLIGFFLLITVIGSPMLLVSANQTLFTFLPNLSIYSTRSGGLDCWGIRHTV